MLFSRCSTRGCGRQTRADRNAACPIVASAAARPASGDPGVSRRDLLGASAAAALAAPLAAPKQAGAVGCVISVRHALRAQGSWRCDAACGARLRPSVAKRALFGGRPTHPLLPAPPHPKTQLPEGDEEAQADTRGLYAAGCAARRSARGRRSAPACCAQGRAVRAPRRPLRAAAPLTAPRRPLPPSLPPQRPAGWVCMTWRPAGARRSSLGTRSR